MVQEIAITDRHADDQFCISMLQLGCATRAKRARTVVDENFARQVSIMV